MYKFPAKLVVDFLTLDVFFLYDSVFIAIIKVLQSPLRFKSHVFYMTKSFLRTSEWTVAEIGTYSLS